MASITKPQTDLALPSTISDALSLARSLQNWRQSEYLPGGITRQRLDEAQALLRQANRSCTVPEFMVLIDELFTFARTFEVKGLDEAKIEDASKLYRKALIDIPPDLLEKAIQRVIASHKWGQRMPLPSEIRAHVNKEVAERSNAIMKIEMAIEGGAEEPKDKPKRSPEDIAFARRVVEDVTRKLRSEDATDVQAKEQAARPE